MICLRSDASSEDRMRGIRLLPKADFISLFSATSDTNYLKIAHLTKDCRKQAITLIDPGQGCPYLNECNGDVSTAAARRPAPFVCEIHVSAGPPNIDASVLLCGLLTLYVRPNGSNWVSTIE